MLTLQIISLVIIIFQYFRWKHGMEERVALTTFLITAILDHDFYRNQSEGFKKFITDAESNNSDPMIALLMQVPRLALNLSSSNAVASEHLVKEYLLKKN